MVIQTTLDRGEGLVRGDIISIRRTVNNIPVGDSISKAYLFVKAAYGDADGAAIFSKTVTTSNVAGTGQVEDDGTTDLSGRIRFDLTNANTTAVTADTPYYYDIQILTTLGSVYTLEIGKATWMAQVTQTVA